jgi:hypothetical protein
LALYRKYITRYHSMRYLARILEAHTQRTGGTQVNKTTFYNHWKTGWPCARLDWVVVRGRSGSLAIRGDRARLHAPRSFVVAIARSADHFQDVYAYGSHTERARGISRSQGDAPVCPVPGSSREWHSVLETYMYMAPPPKTQSPSVLQDAAMDQNSYMDIGP